MERRTRTGAVLTTAAAALLLSALAGGVVDRGEMLTAPPRAVAAPPSIATEPPTPGKAAPVPPDEGAWIGAWVRPDLPTPDGRLAAVADFESQLGRPVDVAHIFRQWEDPFPRSDDQTLARSRTVLLSWGGTDTRQIQSGLYDDLIRDRARDLKRWGVPLLLEWRWEMDRPNLQGEIWSPEDYVAAWKHIRALFQQEQVENVGWVWCPLAVGFGLGRAQAYYPGDEQVDWLCADVYPGPTALSFAAAAGPFLDWARGRPHPVIIGEFGWGVALREDREQSELARQEWLTAAGEFVKTQPQIKGLVYFDSDSSDSPTDPYDTSLRTAPGSMAAFRAVAQQPYFSRPRS